MITQTLSCNCIDDKLYRGRRYNINFRLFKKGSKKPYCITERYTVMAEIFDIFGNLVSEYSYPHIGTNKPILVNGNVVTISLSGYDTLSVGRYTLRLEIFIDENVSIKVEKSYNVRDNIYECCLLADIDVDIFLCDILYTDGITFVPSLKQTDNKLVFSWTNDGGLDNPEPVSVWLPYIGSDGYWYVNGEKTVHKATGVLNIIVSDTEPAKAGENDFWIKP